MNYAGFFRRFAAFIIDIIILWIPSAIFGGGSGGLYGSVGFSFLLTLIYKPIFESSILAGTPGKALMGIAVVTELGEPITVKAAFIRFICTYISAFIMMIGYLMQPFTSRRQTLHDMIAETIVIRRPPPDLNYFRVWRDQLKKVFNSL